MRLKSKDIIGLQQSCLYSSVFIHSPRGRVGLSGPERAFATLPKTLLSEISNSKSQIAGFLGGSGSTRKPSPALRNCPEIKSANCLGTARKLNQHLMFTAKRLRPTAQGCGSYPGRHHPSKILPRSGCVTFELPKIKLGVLLTQPRWGKTVGRALSQTRYATLGYESQPLRGKDQFCV
jgi:hypothetical protein